MKPFIFESYTFDEQTLTADFCYAYDTYKYQETVRFTSALDTYDTAVLDRVLFLAFMLIGSSYYKAFPTTEVQIKQGGLDEWQGGFFSTVYQEGLSQYAFENQLRRDQLATFPVTEAAVPAAIGYAGEGVLALQSGGKDSLLVGQMLREGDTDFTSFYVTSSGSYPAVIDKLGAPTVTATRSIDHQSLRHAAEAGGRNGHVPVTYIVLSIGLIQAVLGGDSVVVAAIGHEGEEPHAWIDDLPVNHQWSKTWQAEQLFAEYVSRYISSDLRVGSIIRQYSELEVAKRFVTMAWQQFGHTFSSCNVANYGQGAQNTQLQWCGHCPKCANSYLLFAPFVAVNELNDLFGSDLFARHDLVATFQGLLGVEGVMKPFECVGEVDELRFAYHQALQRGYTPLPFAVPASTYDEAVRYPSQQLLTNLT